MLPEEITLVCRHCGGRTVSNLYWVQAHWAFLCRHCGETSRLDKDRLSLVLAGRNADATEIVPSPVSDEADRSSPDPHDSLGTATPAASDETPGSGYPDGAEP